MQKKITKNAVDRCAELISNLLNLDLFCISKTTLKTKLYLIAAKKKEWVGRALRFFWMNHFQYQVQPMVKNNQLQRILQMKLRHEEKNGKDKRNIAKVKYENVLVKRKLKRAQNKIVNLKESKEALTKQKDSCIKEIKKNQ